MAFYGYPNTRIRGMKSRLFSSNYFDQLLEARDISEIIANLSKTDYKVDLERGLVKHPGTMGVEEGLKLHIVREYQRILVYIKGNRQAERLIALLLSRWDVHNLKTIFRGIHSEAPREEIADQLVPVGQLDLAYLNTLMDQTDIKACIDLLAMWSFPVARPLTEVYSEYVNTQKLSTLELVIDRYHYQQMLVNTRRFTLSRLNEKMVREFVKKEVDFTNIMTLFRLIRENIKDEDINYADFFIGGGKELDVERMVSLTEEPEVEDVVEKLKDTSYYGVLREGLKKFHFTGALSSLERKIEDHIIKQLVGMFKDDPLSIAIIIAYIWAVFNETVNLRIILRSKDVEMPEDQIREALVLV